MAYESATFYFMTGTGNSYRVACWMADAAATAVASVTTASVENARPASEVGEGRAHLLALSFPTHAFTTPWHLLRFVGRLPRRAGTHAIVIPTRAGTKVGSLYLPGMEGTAGYFVALLLALKGYAVRGVMAVDMPSNWTALHPAFAPIAIEGIRERARGKSEKFVEEVLGGDTFFAGWIPFFLGLLLLPISFAYFFMGRFFLAKLFFASKHCTSCGLCERQCPVGAIKMQGRPPRPYWTFDCESCMRCMAICPMQAVEAGHSLGILLYFATTIPLMDALLRETIRLVPAWTALDHPVMHALLQYPGKLLALYLAYLLFSLLIRSPWINSFFTHTTLTHWYRRYREPETDLSDSRLRRRF